MAEETDNTQGRDQSQDQPAIDFLPNLSGRDYAARGPVTPGTNMPIPPGLTTGAKVEAPAAEEESSKLSGVDAMASAFMQHLLSRTPPPPQAAQSGAGGGAAPGSFKSKLAGALSGIGQGVAEGLGDAASASEGLPEGVGGFGGVTRTLEARNKRLAAEKQRSFENALSTKQDERAERASRQQSALNSIQMSVHQLQLEKAKKELQDDVFSSNKTASKAREDGGFDVEHGVTEEEVKHRMDGYKGAQGEHYTDKFELMPVGKTQINGKMENTYDVVTKSAKDIVPTDQERSFIKDNGGPDIPEGTKVPNNSLTAMRLSAQRTASARQMIEDATTKQLTTDQKKQLSADLQSSVIQHAMSLHAEDPISGLLETKQQQDALVSQLSKLSEAAQAHGDPGAAAEAKQHLAEAQKDQRALNNVFTFGISKEDLENHRKFLEDKEKKRHNIEEEKIGRQKGPGGGMEETDPEAQGLMGPDYLEFLQGKRPNEAGTIKAMGEGRMAMPSRTSKEGLRLAGQLNRAYPDWDQTKGKTWASVRDEYMGKGKNANASISYNAALRHMADLFENTTTNGVLNPGSVEYQRRQDDIGHVKEELAKAVSNGVMAESDKKEFEERLTGGLTPGLKRERIKQSARLLHDRIEEMQTKFEAAKPSAHVDVPRLLSPEATHSFDYVLSDGQTAKPAGQGATVPPQAAAKKVGDTVYQSGKPFKVTSVDKSGKVTGASPVPEGAQ